MAQSGFDDFELLLIFPLPLLDLDLLGLQACTTMSVCSVCGVGTGMRTLCMLGKDFVNYSTSPVSRNNFNSSLACFFCISSERILIPRLNFHDKLLLVTTSSHHMYKVLQFSVLKRGKVVTVCPPHAP